LDTTGDVKKLKKNTPTLNLLKTLFCEQNHGVLEIFAFRFFYVRAKFTFVEHTLDPY
jgi:hypothetical protein